jgi:hypothetical protein
MGPRYSHKMLLLLICFVAADGQSKASGEGARINQETSSNLDAVCKTDPLPPGYVPVAELDSPECKAEIRPKKNAWLIDKVRDKIVSCAPPDYESGYPPVIAYAVCSRVSTSNCPARLDGSPNGYELTLGSSCTARKSSGLVCVKGRNDLHGEPFDFSRDIPNSDKELNFWVMERISNDATCMATYQDRAPDRLIYWDSISDEEQVPLCSSLNLSTIYNMHARNIFSHYPKYITIRRFFSDLCPKWPDDFFVKGEFYVVGEANAMIVQKLPKEKWHSCVTYHSMAI